VPPRYVGRLLRRIAAEGSFRVRALELEPTAAVSADFAGRARINSSGTIWRELPSWDWATAGDMNETMLSTTRPTTDMRDGEIMKLKMRVMQSFGLSRAALNYWFIGSVS